MQHTDESRLTKGRQIHHTEFHVSLREELAIIHQLFNTISSGASSTSRSLGIATKLHRFLYGSGHVQSTELFRDNLPNYKLGALREGTAAGCIFDTYRTAQFLNAIELSLLYALKRKEGVVQFVDAGCGPLAVFGIFAALKDPRVRVTCLELNPVSARIAESVVNRLNLSDQIKVINCDAIRYQHHPTVDVFVSETMFSALTNDEPILNIMRNFRPQLSSMGVMIPEYVTVDYSLRPTQRSRSDSSNKLVAADFQTAVKFKSGECRRIDFDVPLEHRAPGRYQLYLSSTVGLRAVPEIKLRPGDAVVVSMEPVGDEVRINRRHAALNVSYMPGADISKIALKLKPLQ